MLLNVPFPIVVECFKCYQSRELKITNEHRKYKNVFVL